MSKALSSIWHGNRQRRLDEVEPRSRRIYDGGEALIEDSGQSRSPWRDYCSDLKVEIVVVESGKWKISQSSERKHLRSFCRELFYFSRSRCCFVKLYACSAIIMLAAPPLKAENYGNCIMTTVSTCAGSSLPPRGGGEMESPELLFQGGKNSRRALALLVMKRVPPPP